MIELFPKVLWLALPVVVSASAHMVVVKKGLFSRLAIPIDGGRSLGEARVFGDNKTWRGFVFVPLASALAGSIQGALGGSFAEQAGLQCVDARAIFGVEPLFGAPDFLRLAAGYAVVGFVLGLGYVLGELPNSFAKRRLGVHPGERAPGLYGPLFFIVDRTDSVLAAFALGALVFSYSISVVAAGVFCLSFVHLAVSAALYKARIKKSI